MKQISNMTIRRKLLAVILLITFIFCILFGRLLFVQVINSYDLQRKALDEWTRDLPLSSKRGEIYDRNGVTLATSITKYVLYIRPNAVRDVDKVASVISDTLGIDREYVLSKVRKKGTSEVKIASDISKEEMASIKAQHLAGVYFATSNKRVYPYGDLMMQLMGFTNVDNVGQTGVEDYYNNYLSGVDGKILTETDLVGNEIASSTHFVPSIDGLDVYLTIDYYMQKFADSAVKDAMRRYNAKNASCIIMDVDTGELYAYAKAPSFDLNDIPRDNLDELFSASKIGMVSDVYEPGSTFKILTSAIGLEEKAFGEGHRFYCPGYRMVDGHKIKCWKTRGHGSQSFPEGIENSCNCVFMDIATKVGTKKMYEYFDKFGINKKTGIDIKGETRGILLKESSVKNVDIARIGFGQAIAVTPIGLLSATCSIINGGYKVSPTILRSIKGKDKVINNEKQKGERIVSLSTSQKMREYLERVVTNGGGKNAKVEGYRIGGKTGTAQKYANGSIASGKYISSFIGFAPMDDPKYAMLMIVDEPEGYKYYGSLVAAPYAKDIFSNIFAYKGIKPTVDVVEPKDIVMPSILGKSVDEAEDILKQYHLTYTYSGDGEKVIYQFPAEGAIIDENTVTFFEIG